ncbi:MAG TPA: carboxylate-amine ligase [Aggregatilineales bacterium]|nr:carboxylate-amine ligase [Chloroflexota bacterium]HOA24732.1 carboxylate-amine ligase [Aggregatilineales bacterium]HPV07762.1 carboxylate-amine ligase [Aggregatilineales bacterium]HQA68235.1 carboxylate-amine ligase [Aggregatilineales bacterium]HQE18487.1 carboxylate-amine ligase [Aggregatilineales bacterium]
MERPPLDIGIEEEYQIIDPQTRELTSYVQQFLNVGRVRGRRIQQEFMQSQVEIGTRVCKNIDEAREEIRHMRRTMLEIADSAGVWLAAAGTHPFSRWEDQVISESERYVEFVESMQHVVRSLLIFGMHVHIGFGDTPAQRELLITVMNQARYFVPHILALSTSSPFWMGHNTGLKSYRNIVFESMPRTGLPMEFRSWSEYENFTRVLANVGALQRTSDGQIDTTRIWWDMRPHPRYNTLEFRVCDMVTTLDEVICIAALFQALVAKLVKLREQNIMWRIYRRDLVRENKWRAVRYGVTGSLIDFGKEEQVPFPDLVDELIDFLDDVVDELGSREAVEYARVIARNGSSADRQLRVYEASLAAGLDQRAALQAVVDHLVEETRSGLI